MPYLPSNDKVNSLLKTTTGDGTFADKLRRWAKNKFGDAYSSYNTAKTKFVEEYGNADVVNQTDDLLDFSAMDENLDDRMNFSRNSLATAFNQDGKLVLYDYNKPRFEYDPVTGEKKGVFLEPQSSTNYARYSYDFLAYLSRNYFSLSSEVTPLFKTDADVAIKNYVRTISATSQYPYLNQYNGNPAYINSYSGYNVISFFVRATPDVDTNGTFVVYVYDGFNNTITTRTICIEKPWNTPLSPYSGYEHVSGNWYRVWFSWYNTTCKYVPQQGRTVCTSQNHANRIYFRSSNSYNNRFTYPNPIAMFGYQHERNSKPSSYMYTSGSVPVSRSGELMYMDKDVDTEDAVIEVKGESKTGDSATIVDMKNTSSNVSTALRVNLTQLFTVKDNTSASVLMPSDQAVVDFNGSNVSASTDVSSTNTSSLPTVGGANRLYFGMTFGQSTNPAVRISRFRTFRRRMANYYSRIFR